MGVCEEKMARQTLRKQAEDRMSRLPAPAGEWEEMMSKRPAEEAQVCIEKLGESALTLPAKAKLSKTTNNSERCKE